ncbi:MAG: hypothetical protein KAG61_12480 [Bacteriovoracaceae bacterium]|nr:hypothetical protein [Bacteriovoracaceae bacterium]
MKKLFIALIALTLSFGVMADASKGQKYYLKYLRPHFSYNGQKFAEKYLKVEWKRMFKKDAKRFIKTFSKKFPESATFLKSERFQKIAPHIKDFTIKYAADSGELPSCS